MGRYTSKITLRCCCTGFRILTFCFVFCLFVVVRRSVVVVVVVVVVVLINLLSLLLSRQKVVLYIDMK